MVECRYGMVTPMNQTDAGVDEMHGYVRYGGLVWWSIVW